MFRLIARHGGCLAKPLPLSSAASRRGFAVKRDLTRNSSAWFDLNGGHRAATGREVSVYVFDHNAHVKTEHLHISSLVHEAGGHARGEERTWCGLDDESRLHNVDDRVADAQRLAINHIDRPPWVGLDANAGQS